MSEPITHVLPWHAAIWQRVMKQRHAGQLPHAMLISGPDGVGKKIFTHALAHTLLCSAPRDDGAACGHCAACALLRAGTHPDLVQVHPEEEGKSISIDQIRELRDGVTLCSHAGGFKVVVIHPADRMTVAAANALLKTLEEPSGRAVLMLVTSRLSSLLATVRSRCQRLDFAVPAREQALGWLQSQLEPAAVKDAAVLLALAQGAPLRAVDLSAQGALEQRKRLLEELHGVALGKSDPVSVAERWHKAGMKQAWSWLSSCAVDLVRLKFDAAPSLLNNVDAAPLLRELAPRINARDLFLWSDRVNQAQLEAETPINQQMVVEDVLIAWERQFSATREPLKQMR